MTSTTCPSNTLDNALHVPVMMREVLDAMSPKAGEHYIDGTFGAGGYTKHILNAADCKVLGIDRDPQALALGSALMPQFNERLTLAEGNFGDIQNIAAEHNFSPIHGIVLDIGVSSMQIDEATRGFSFMQDGPLDMRMSQAGTSAQDLVNTASEMQLADIFYYYGEERQAKTIARAIVAYRSEQPITTTRQLVQIITKIIWIKPNKIHPATRTFQALRIAVNDELGELVRALHAAEQMLCDGGRLVVVTFHSLEDRIVKHFFSSRSGKLTAGSRHAPPTHEGSQASFVLMGKQPLAANDEEIARNPRSRSAKMRVGIRNSAQAHPLDATLINLAALPLPDNRRGRK